MKLVIRQLAMLWCGLWLVAVEAAESPAIPVNYWSSGGGGGVNKMVGWEFQPTSDILVSALGVLDVTCTADHPACPDGMSQDHEIGIWEADTQTLVAFTIVPTGTSSRKVDVFRYVDITPIELTANQNYVIASYNPAPDDDGFAFGANVPAADIPFDSRLAWVQSRYLPFINGFQFPNGGTEYAGPFLGPNFLIYEEDEPADSDGDGVIDEDDICPGGDDNVDFDGDLVPDFCDPCPLDAANDADGDGVCGDVDVCMGGDDSLDLDFDATPDFCDVCPQDPENDADGDGVCELDDNCEVVWNPSQIDSDGDSYGDACDTDNDNDGVPNEADNCEFDANPGQEDWDGDGAGDVCDADSDGDGVVDSIDQCLNSPPGDPVDGAGCTISELCPCEHPVSGSKWKNHGAYVRCVAHTSEDFEDAGLISEVEKDAIVSTAGQSECGKKH